MEKETILIAGGTGLIGSVLSPLLVKEGYNVLHLSRTPSKKDKYPTYRWNLQNNEIDPDAIDQCDSIINLAGAGIADKKWTRNRKDLIIKSRIQSTQLLASKLKEAGKTPKKFISASAIGYYGNSGNKWMGESSAAGTGFLAESTIQWEQSIQAVSNLGWNVSWVRIGIVLALNGGALNKMLLPLRFGVSAYFGNGKQYYSWIHIKDLARLFLFLLKNPDINGAINGVAPEPVTNYAFAKSLSKARNGFSITAPVPSILLRLILGEMADVVLTGSKVSSQKIESLGFQFNYGGLLEALEQIFSKK